MKQTATVTQRGNTDRTFFSFFFDWGYMCGCQTTKTWLASQAPLQCSLWKLPYCEYVQAENLSGYSWFSSWTGVICGGITPKDNTCSQTPLQNFTKNLSCYIEENMKKCSLHHWNVFITPLKCVAMTDVSLHFNQPLLSSSLIWPQ